MTGWSKPKMSIKKVQVLGIKGHKILLCEKNNFALILRLKRSKFKISLCYDTDLPTQIVDTSVS